MGYSPPQAGRIVGPLTRLTPTHRAPSPGWAFNEILQTRTVWSLEADARRWPSGLNATPVTSGRPPHGSASRPVAASQTRTVMSLEADANGRRRG